MTEQDVVRRLGSARVDDIVTALSVDDERRAHLLVEMLAAALMAVEPEAAVIRALNGESLEGPPVTIVALGKAAPAMARGAAAVLGERLSGGIVVSNHAEKLPAGLELVVTSHPAPDKSSLRAGQRLVDLVGGVPGAGRLLFLISGGGSALAEVPAPGLDLPDLSAVSAVLMNAGIPIDQTNTVRTHLSAIKGGRLAAIAAAPHTTILISDVPAASPHLVASGPTLPCPTTPGDALAVLARHRLMDVVPHQVIRVLETAPPPPVVPDSHLVAADGPLAAAAAAREAEANGLTTAISPRDLTGSATEMAAEALAIATEGEVTIFSGETTVEVKGTGRGGRNQEAALAASLHEAGGSGVFVAFGTDGIDGPTDAAGAIIDGFTAQRIREGGLDPSAALAANDSHPALDAGGALIRCGPTATNVADIWIVDRR